MTENVYTRNGYKNREDYLTKVAEDYGVPPMIAFEIAAMLGAEEDFDGLVTSLDDFSVCGLLDM